MYSVVCEDLKMREWGFVVLQGMSSVVIFGFDSLDLCVFVNLFVVSFYSSLYRNHDYCLFYCTYHLPLLLLFIITIFFTC